MYLVSPVIGDNSESFNSGVSKTRFQRLFPSFETQTDSTAKRTKRRVAAESRTTNQGVVGRWGEGKVVPGVTACRFDAPPVDA